MQCSKSFFCKQQHNEPAKMKTRDIIIPIDIHHLDWLREVNGGIGGQAWNPMNQGIGCRHFDCIACQWEICCKSRTGAWHGMVSTRFRGSFLTQLLLGLFAGLPFYKTNSFKFLKILFF